MRSGEYSTNHKMLENLQNCKNISLFQLLEQEQRNVELFGKYYKIQEFTQFYTKINVAKFTFFGKFGHFRPLKCSIFFYFSPKYRQNVAFFREIRPFPR